MPRKMRCYDYSFIKQYYRARVVEIDLEGEVWIENARGSGWLTSAEIESYLFWLQCRHPFELIAHGYGTAAAETNWQF